MKEINKDGEYEDNCPHCHRIINSKYEAQFDYNFKTHVKYCPMREKKK